MSIADRIAGIPRGLPGIQRSAIDAYRCGHQEAIQAAVRIGVEADEAMRELRDERDRLAARVAELEARNG